MRNIHYFKGQVSTCPYTIVLANLLRVGDIITGSSFAFGKTRERIMDYKEQDSKNTPTHTFHPLIFAVLASIIVLLVTGIISYIYNPRLASHIPFYKPTFSLQSVKKAPWITASVKKGDNLKKIFIREKLNLNDYLAIIQLPAIQQYLTKLNPKQNIYLLLHKQRQIHKLVYMIDHAHYLELDKTEKGFKTKVITVKLLKKSTLAKGTIHQSFALAAHRAGLSDQTIMALSSIFSWDMNFSRDTRPGDQFVVLYDTYFDHGKKVKSGKIIAAEFINKSKKLYAIRYRAQKGKINYYSQTGHNLRRAFLRVPIKYQYVSSPFNSNRMHPILHIVRPHEGVDLAAITGTPIHATSDGRIIFRGRRGGYGKAIIMQNTSKYTTLFAHMSRFAKKYHVGSYIKEGQVIGYVGQTGLATGPHLHYEFRINGVHYDPMKIKLPDAKPIPKKELSTYLAYAKTIVEQLNHS